MPFSLSSSQARRGLYVGVIITAIIAGTVVSPYVTQAVGSAVTANQNTIAVIEIDGRMTIDTAETVSNQLYAARQDTSVKAVVLRVNSPGGTISAAESVYMAVNATAQQKPVVASVGGIAASGGYFSLLPAERIYTTPGAPVGNVGVIGVRPAEDGAEERIVSGPDKIRGGTKDDFRRQVQSLQREFVGTVMFHRKDELTISRTQVAHAKVYIGGRAVQNGLADRIGSHHDAIAHAAARAGINRYSIASGYDLARNGAAASLAVASQNETDHSTLDADTVDRRRILALYGQPDTPGEVVTNATG